MRIGNSNLDARLNDTDRRLMAVAAESHAFEAAATRKGPAPISYSAVKSRLAYTNGLEQLERRLRLLATEAGRWHVRLNTAFESVPVLPLYRKAGIVPPMAIRNLSMSNQFFLVRVTGRFSPVGSMRVASLRYALDFRGVGRASVRQPAVHALFPGIGARRYDGAAVFFGLRSTLEFWVAVTPGGSLVESVDRMPENVRADMVFGPVRYQFGKTHAVGAAARSANVEWSFPGAAVAAGAKFVNLLVIRLPKGQSSCRVQATIEANVMTPTSLQSLLGRRRLLRDTRHSTLRMAGVGR